MDLVIVTGLSGAGKSVALNALEDAGFFCIDNLPPDLLPKLLDMYNLPNFQIDKIALGIDFRTKNFKHILSEQLINLKGEEIKYQILFLEATDEALIRRYKETRRKHPVKNVKTIEQGIELEKVHLTKLRENADYIIDTTNLNVHELHDVIINKFIDNIDTLPFKILIRSFGYKFGIPLDSDFIFDVRTLPNPHYKKSLKLLTGNNIKVVEFIFKSAKEKEFFDKLYEFVLYVINVSIQEHRYGINISIGCTGGKHRSVAVVNKINQLLKNIFNSDSFEIITNHRDINKKKL